MLDDTDRRILRQYQATPQAPFAELADRCGVTATTLSRRIEKMREAGIVRGVRGVIDWTALGYTVEVSLRVTLDKSAPRAFEDFLTAAREVPEVLEIQTFLGQVDVRLSVIALKKEEKGLFRLNQFSSFFLVRIHLYTSEMV